MKVKPANAATPAEIKKYSHLLKFVKATKQECKATTRHNIISKMYKRCYVSVKTQGGSEAVALAVGRQAFQKMCKIWASYFG